jgi:sporulation protein YlmC with PRC-barrel domain
MRRIGLVPAIALVGFLVEFCGGPVHAQGKFDLEDWDYDELRTGWSVERLTEAAEVVDPDGEKVGEVEDLIAGPDGKIRKLVIEAGGFLDVGDAHLAYPFEQATFEGPDRIVVELDQDKIGDYSLFAEGDDEPAHQHGRHDQGGRGLSRRHGGQGVGSGSAAVPARGGPVRPGSLLLPGAVQ